MNATYGFGTGEILVTDGDGVEHDVTRFLDDDGNLISEFPHPNTGPVPASVRARAMSVQLPEPLLPLLQAGALAVLAAVSSRSSSRTRARSRSERRQQG